MVTGTTGFEPDPAWAEQRDVGVFVASNFAIGAVLMMRFAEQAARHLPDVEIVELHHGDKPDAPSGGPRSRRPGASPRRVAETAPPTAAQEPRVALRWNVSRVHGGRTSTACGSIRSG